VIKRVSSFGVLVAVLLVAGIVVVAVGGGAALSSAMQTADSTPVACASPEASPAASPEASASPSASPEAPCGPVAMTEPPAECLPTADGLVLPVAANPIVNTATAAGLVIVEAKVEDNVDPATGGDAADHLEIKLRNDSSAELSGFIVYYEITDLVDGTKEAYCSALTGFTIPAGGERVAHFDRTGQPDHFPDNEFSLFHASLNEMQFDITVSATGVAPQTTTITKDAGGNEDPND
jgi:hypothetical protein